jgi:hypothetical protein
MLSKDICVFNLQAPNNSFGAVQLFEESSSI